MVPPRDGPEVTTSGRRVVVTGLGVVSPLGVGLPAFWKGLVAGQSGIGPVSRFDAAAFPTRIAGEVPDFDPLAHLSRRDVVRTDSFIQYGLIAAQEAVADAGLRVAEAPERVGVSVGTGLGGVPTLLGVQATLAAEGVAAVSPYALPAFLPNMAAGWISMKTGARGPIAAPTTACAAGAQAVGEAFRAIQRGEADAMLAGGTDAPIQPVIFASFSALRALSTRNDDPERASRPFDRGRDGFVLAEGAGILVLEERDRARARGARIYAELIGFGLTADAYHPTAPSEAGPARALRLALADGGVRPEDVGYVNAHGTSTPQNDANETRVLRGVFGAHAGRLAVSSTKSMTGHLLGAAGAVEAVVTACVLHHGLVPPTINLSTPDPACDLDYVPGSARPLRVEVAVSNSFAFGGINAILALRREGAETEADGPAPVGSGGSPG
jgi:3-oxoacyl-[acyl-carrier-protein] synthase II